MKGKMHDCKLRKCFRLAILNAAGILPLVTLVISAKGGGVLAKFFSTFRAVMCPAGG